MAAEVGSKLLARPISDDDHVGFAALSGDFNPLHMDPIEARRTLLGQPVVHGLHLVLLALEAIGGVLHKAMKPAALRARFPSPVMVGETIELRLAETDGARRRIEGFVGFDRVLDLSVVFGEGADDDGPPVPPLEPVPLHDLRLDELSGMAQSLQVGIDPVLAGKLFPGIAADFGLPLLAELVALSRLVGMRCPGRFSLLSQLDLTLGRVAPPGPLRFQVNGVDDRFLRIDMQVEGAMLSGKLVAFYLPPPQPQPRMADLAEIVRRDEFHGSVALVVGGSRGLGETHAKKLGPRGARRAGCTP